MLTISQRRSLSTRALFDQAFRKALVDDPQAALADALGIDFPADEAVAIIEESATRWAFVLPVVSDIEAELPEPTDARTAIENQVYAVLRDEPDTVEIAARDPRTFLFERFGVEVNGIDLRRECAGMTVILIPHEASREELSDEMLDLVAAGGNVPINNADSTGSAKS